MMRWTIPLCLILLAPMPAQAAPTYTPTCLFEVTAGGSRTCSVTWSMSGSYKVQPHGFFHESAVMMAGFSLTWTDAWGRVVYTYACDPAVSTSGGTNGEFEANVNQSACYQGIARGYVAGTQRLTVEASAEACGHPTCTFHGMLTLTPS